MEPSWIFKRVGSSWASGCEKQAGKSPPWLTAAIRILEWKMDRVWRLTGARGVRPKIVQQPSKAPPAATACRHRMSQTHRRSQRRAFVAGEWIRGRPLRWRGQRALKRKTLETLGSFLGTERRRRGGGGGGWRPTCWVWRQRKVQGSSEKPHGFYLQVQTLLLS